MTLLKSYDLKPHVESVVDKKFMVLGDCCNIEESEIVESKEIVVEKD